MPTFAQKKQPTKRNNTFENPCYDYKLDRQMIEASFAATYGILPSEQRKMRHADYEIMLAGISPDTPLVRLIQIRREKTVEELKNLNEYERREYFKWQNYKNQKLSLQSRREAIDDAFRALL